MIITNRRNLEIEIYRFLMIIAVSVIHFNEDLNLDSFKGGYLGVDFFFVLSGFYLMFYFIKYYKEGDDPNKSAAKYFWYRLKKLYPPYIVSILIMTFVSWADAGFGLKNLYFYIWGNKWQFFMLHSIGAPTSCIMRSIWFMSPLMVLSYVIYLMLCYNKKIFVGISPVIALLGLAYIAQKYHFLGIQFEYDGFLVGGLIRGLSEMSLGVYLAYLVDEYLKKDRKIRVNPVAGILIRIFSYIVLLSTMCNSQWNVEDFTIFIPIIILILISYVDPIKIPFGNIVSKFVGLSYWIYLLHIIVSHVMVCYFSPFDYMKGLMVYLLISVLLSVVLNLLLKKLLNNIKKMKKTY